MSSYVCQKCDKKIIGTVHLNQQGTFHAMCATPPNHPDDTSKKPENVNTSAEHVRAVDVSDTKLAGAVDEIWAIVKKDSLASSRIGSPALYTREAMQVKLLALITSARSDWAKEVEAKLPKNKPESEILDMREGFALGYNQALDEVRAIVREVG